MKPAVTHIDHLVLTVADIKNTLEFYQVVMGMDARPFKPDDGATRWSLSFGAQKINLHQAGAEFEPKAKHPVPGTADLCFLSDTSLATWEGHLAECGVVIEDGPVPRTGANGPLSSIYIRDPDGNLIEISNVAG